MKKFLTPYCLLLSISLFIIACNDDDKSDLVKEPDTQTYYRESSNETRPISKALPRIKNSAVYYLQADGSFRRYNTKKFMSRDSSVIQEWFVENFRETDFFSNYVTYPGDTDTTIGLYYYWQTNFGYLRRGDFDGLIFKTAYESNSNQANGFNIPTENELTAFGRMLGDDSYIRSRINLGYNFYYTPTFGFGNTQYPPANIWVDARYDGNKKPGCGVHIQWTNPNDHVYYCYPNASDVACNVRLMRTLSLAQWEE